MKQLKMCRIMTDKPIRRDLPEGYSICNYSGAADKEQWCECCRKGRLIDESTGVKAFDDSITAIAEIDPYKDVFFLKYNGEAVGTATAFVRADGTGDLHMVSIKPGYRGKGLCRYLLGAPIEKLHRDGVEYTFLTTDEFRQSAIKSYLTAGFLPVDYDTDMKERWESVLRELDIESVTMLKEDLITIEKIYRKKQ